MRVSGFATASKRCVSGIIAGRHVIIKLTLALVTDSLGLLRKMQILEPLKFRLSNFTVVSKV